MPKKTELIMHNKYLKCELTEEEVITLAKETAQLHQQLADAEAARKAAASDWKAKIDDLTNDVAKRSRLIRDGYEHRYVECVLIEEDWQKMTRIFSRTDTGEMVHEKIPQQESQMKMEV